jgi:hypothetical protein
VRVRKEKSQLVAAATLRHVKLLVSVDAQRRLGSVDISCQYVAVNWPA